MWMLPMWKLKRWRISWSLGRNLMAVNTPTDPNRTWPNVSVTVKPCWDQRARLWNFHHAPLPLCSWVWNIIMIYGYAYGRMDEHTDCFLSLRLCMCYVCTNINKHLLLDVVVVVVILTKTIYYMGKLLWGEHLHHRKALDFQRRVRPNCYYISWICI